MNISFPKFTTMASIILLVGSEIPGLQAQERIKFNNPGLATDLAVGLWAWPMPMDWDCDGDLDLIVSCPDVPYNGVYFFENPGGNIKMPVFKPGIRIGNGLKDIQVSYLEGQPRLLKGLDHVTPKIVEYVDFLGKGFGKSKEISYPKIELGDGKVRANQWKLVDYDGDGALDLIHGVGYWGDYGWDNAFDANGTWMRGPLRGWVYVFRNKGSNDTPSYEVGFHLQAGGKQVDVYGMPSPNFADYDGDGDLDLICGEFLDGFTWFENIGTRTKPIYKAGNYLLANKEKIHMHVQMITPVAIDWDRDGDIDLVVGDEDGRVALVENTGDVVGGMPRFLPPAYFQQVADDLKFGALVTPFSVDWDHDGDEDLICGNTSGNIGYIENLDGRNPPRWAKPILLDAGGSTIHVQAGINGSIQGPAEAKWGYTVPNVADWGGDGLLDLLVNDIMGKVFWYKGVGSKVAPMLAKGVPIEVEWLGTPPNPAWNWAKPNPRELVTQWRTTPCVIDWDHDGLNDLVMLDHEGYLAFFKREEKGGELVLLPGKRIFEGGRFNNKQAVGNADVGGLLRLNVDSAGQSGRRKLCFIDWDGDGDLDLLVNTVNIGWLENSGEKCGMTRFIDRGDLGKARLAGHTTCPTTVDWGKDGKRDVLIGAEDGRFYFIPNLNSIRTTLGE